MAINRVAHKLGLSLATVCMVYGLLIALIFRSFTATIVPSTEGRDTPEVLSIVIALAAMLFLGIIAPIQLFKMAGRSQLRKRWSWVSEAILLVLAVAALVRGVMRIGTVLSGEIAVMSVVTEVWFIVVGLLGLAFFASLQGCRWQLRRYDQGKSMRWDDGLEETVSVDELIRRRTQKNKSR